MENFVRAPLEDEAATLKMVNNELREALKKIFPG